MSKTHYPTSIITKLLGLPCKCMVPDIKHMFSVFSGIEVPDDDIKIVDGRERVAFVIFRSDESARLATRNGDHSIGGQPIKIMLSSRVEMNRVLTNNNMISKSKKSNAVSQNNSSSGETKNVSKQNSKCTLSYQQASELIMKNGDLLKTLQKIIESHPKSAKRGDDGKTITQSNNHVSAAENSENFPAKSQVPKLNITDASNTKAATSDSNHLNCSFWSPTSSCISNSESMTNVATEETPISMFQSYALMNYGAHLANPNAEQSNNAFGEQHPAYLLPGFAPSVSPCYDYTSLTLQHGYTPYAYAGYSAYPCEPFIPNNVQYVPPVNVAAVTCVPSTFPVGSDLKYNEQAGSESFACADSEKMPPASNDATCATIIKSEFLQISNMPTTFSYREVRNVFSPILIDVECIKIVNNEHGERTGKALVQFKNVAEAEEAFNNAFKNGYCVQYCTEFAYAHTVDSFVPMILNSCSGKEFHCVRISGFPRSWCESDVERFLKSVNFSKDIKPIHIIIDDGERIAAVVLNSNKDFEKALFYDEYVIGNRSVSVKSISRAEFESLTSNEQSESHRRRSDYTFSSRTTCLRMLNLPISYTENDVYDMFKELKCEIPVEIELQPGDPPRKAYIRFEDNSACKEAYSLRKEFLEDYSLTLQPISLREFELETSNLRKCTGQKRAQNDYDSSGYTDDADDGLDNKIASYDNRWANIIDRSSQYMYKNERNHTRSHRFNGSSEHHPCEKNDYSSAKRRKFSDNSDSHRSRLNGKPSQVSNYQKCIHHLKSLQFPDELLAIARRVIILSNVPYKTEKSELYTLVAKYGPDKNLLKLRQDDNGKPTGDAIVAVKTEQDAKIAVQNLNGFMFNNRRLFACLMSRIVD